MLNPLVSIIIPAYNTERYLPRCLDSVLAQSRRDFEIIVIDDGSTDATGDICEGYGKKEAGRVKVIRQDNKGVSAARNAGLDATSGRFAMFVDSDDTLPVDAVESLMPESGHAGQQLWIGDINIEGKWDYGYLGAALTEYSPVSYCLEILTDPIMAFLSSTPSAKRFDLEVVKANNCRFDENLVNGEDGLFVMDYLSHIRQICSVKKNVYNLHRYSPLERMSASAEFYYDFIYVNARHSEKMHHIVKDRLSTEQEALFYSGLLDGLIACLVRAFAYESCFDRAEMNRLLDDLLRSEMVTTAAKKYRRRNPGHSLLIPLALKTGNRFLLRTCLELRTRNYWKTHERAHSAKSVYRWPRIRNCGTGRFSL